MCIIHRYCNAEVIQLLLFNFFVFYVSTIERKTDSFKEYDFWSEKKCSPSFGTCERCVFRIKCITMSY